MTLSEFKAWFEGFTEDMGTRPTDKQWKRINARVKEINGTVITREYVYNHWPWYVTPTRTYETYGTITSNNTLPLNVSNCLASSNGDGGSYFGAQDLNAIGKAEYQESLAA